MKISITDTGSGIAEKFAQAIGAEVRGRYIYIPKNQGGGYITGFSWGKELRMMVRNYYLNKAVFIERTNELAEDQDDIVFLLTGVLPSLSKPEKKLFTEQAHVLICKHAVSSIMDIPSSTIFGSVTIAVSRRYLNQLFGNIQHPVAESILNAKDNFVFETDISPEIVKAASELLCSPVPESLESQFYKLKCEELLCYTFALLIRREAIPAKAMHIVDIKAIYAIKTHLQSNLAEAPNIEALARNGRMSEPKLRKLFKQTFGKGVFEYYQSLRMEKAAMLLKEKTGLMDKIQATILCNRFLS